MCKKRKQATYHPMMLGGLKKTIRLHVTRGQTGGFIGHPEAIPVFDHELAILIHISPDAFGVIFGGFGQGRRATASQDDRNKTQYSQQ
jgi:hypothetical protein